jgi:RNA polymerase sigma-70 factor (ECF subfamily)
VSQSILHRVAAGDRAAFEECLDRYGNLVWSVARRFTRDRGDAEDVVQEIFVQIWKSAGRYDPDVAAESTFITTIARRRMIDWVRAKQRRPEPVELPEHEMPSDDRLHEQLETNDEAARAARALEQLKPEQRHVLKLSIFHGWTHSEIAEKLKLPLGTVKSHARRGLIAVRERLQRQQVAS